MPDLTGQAGAIALVGDSHSTAGVFSPSILASAPNGTNVAWLQSGTGYLASLKFIASKGDAIYGRAATIMPPSVNLPICLYLGRASEI